MAINLGRTGRWAGRTGAVERAKAALTRRTTGVHGADYILHVLHPTKAGKTYCGRVAAKVNCTCPSDTDLGREEICKICSKRAGTSAQKKPSGGCSRCGGTGQDPDSTNCTCDCCGGTGVEYTS